MPELTPELRSLRARIAAHDPKRAEHLRKAHYARMALKSAQARRRRGGDGNAA
jgi:hypothetical protein